VPATTRLTVTIALPLRDREGLRTAVRRVSDPKDRMFRHYVTPERFGERFGATASDYEGVKSWAESHGFSVVTHRNRFTMEATATASNIEAALHVRLNHSLRPDGTQFYAPDTEPSLDLDIRVDRIGDLDNYNVPKSMARDGTGNNGWYDMQDLRNAYIPSLNNSTANGYGQQVAIVDGGNECFLQSDISSYWAAWSRSTGNTPPSNNVGVNSYLVEAELHCGETGYLPGLETTLDIEMVTAMAPMAWINVFGGTDDEIFQGISDFTHLQTVVTSSWFPSSGYDSTVEALMDQMALQGTTLLQAAGDTGAYSNTTAPNNLADEREQAVTVVGGTLLSMNAPGVSYLQESVWNDSDGITGGGIMSNYQGGTALPIPWYQYTLAYGSNGASSAYRNAPDVAIVADQLQIWITPVAGGNSTPQQAWGTSASAPLWAGYTALVNQQAAANGVGYVGFANPVLYDLAASSNYTSYFNDIGNAEVGEGGGSNPTLCPDAGTCDVNSYTAGTGYDLASGLGTPAPALFNALVGKTTWTWDSFSLTGIPSAVTSIVGTAYGDAIGAWAIDSTPAQSGSSDHQIWYFSEANYLWHQASGGALQVTVSPTTAYPWVVNHAGSVYYSSSQGSGWTEVTTGATPLQSIAVGATASNGTQIAWGISEIAQSGDYEVWDYNRTTAYSWAHSSPNGAAQHIAADGAGNVWTINHTSAIYMLPSGGTAWKQVQDTLDGGSVGWPGSATSIGLGPNNEAWLINNQVCGTCTLDHEIFALTAFNTSSDTAWARQPGGALSVAVDSNGNPWVINHDSTVYVGSSNWLDGPGEP
jgi:subtilase family serine protease